MMQLQFDTATEYLNKEKAGNPDNAAPYYIAHYIDFLKAFLSEEEKDYIQLKNNFDIRIQAIEIKGAGSPWLNMAKGEMLLQMALVKMKRKEYISAGYYIRRSFKLLEENQNKFPAFLPNLKPLGFIHSIIGAIPENYKWISNLVGLKGTISQGGGELSMLLEKINNTGQYEFLKTETAFLKIFIATHLEKNYASAFLILENLKKTTNPANPLLTFLQANSHIMSGNPGEGLKVIKSFQSQKGQYPLQYLNYVTGMLKLYNLDYEASTSFNRYTEGFKGKSFVKSAYHKLAWIQLLKNDTTGYRNYLNKVLKNGDDFTDEDKQAVKDALSKEFPNIYLLRSRLLFDGGNYNLALSELAEKPAGTFSKLKDQLEYTYRLARIFDKKGQTAKAIQYYTATYENGLRTEWYFAANAALNNGLIYEIKKDKTNAIAWFKKCLALRNHEYQNSIDHKAEAGINRLGG